MFIEPKIENLAFKPSCFRCTMSSKHTKQEQNLGRLGQKSERGVLNASQWGERPFPSSSSSLHNSEFCSSGQSFFGPGRWGL